MILFLVYCSYGFFFFFFFNDTATTEIYTLSLHDALPILLAPLNIVLFSDGIPDFPGAGQNAAQGALRQDRSEEHTSELQSRLHLVCRLLLEKKKKKNASTIFCLTHTS